MDISIIQQTRGRCNCVFGVGEGIIPTVGYTGLAKYVESLISSQMSRRKNRMKKTPLTDFLGAESSIAADGVPGTMVMALALRPGDTPELWNAERADDVYGIYFGDLV